MSESKNAPGESVMRLGDIKDRPTSGGWTAAPARTLVDHVVNEILAAAARGQILPGERLIEKDLSASLNMSRVPIREALRVLESQGVVVSEPYKGIRLMDMSRERLEQILDVRATLETLAVTRAHEAGRLTPSNLALLRREIDEMRLMRDRGDIYGLASADTAFHQCLVELSGNHPLIALWRSLSRQLTVIIGLSAIDKAMDQIVAEHEKLLNTLNTGNLDAIRAELAEHIITQIMSVDFDHLTKSPASPVRA